MASGFPQLHHELPNDTWREIDALIEEIARLSSTELPPAEFYCQTLERVVRGLAAAGGVLWICGADGDLRPEYQSPPGAAPWLESVEARHRHRELAQRTLETGQPNLVSPRSGPRPAEDMTRNPSEFLLVICPWSIDGRPLGVVEIFQHPGTSPKIQEGYLHFLTAIGELAAAFDRRRQVSDLREQLAAWGRFGKFTQRIHGELDLQSTAYRIANEVRRFIDCDRASVLLCRREQCRLLAVSGVDTFQRRAGMVRGLERLSAAVAVAGESLWHGGVEHDLPPAIEQALQVYLDTSHARAIAVLPLLPPESEPSHPAAAASGTLVVEWFYRDLDDRLRETIETVRIHSALALFSAVQLSQIPLAGLLGRLGGAWQGRRLVRWAAPLAVAALAAVLLAVWPANFDIEARGKLQPQTLREVFAPTDGVIGELRVRHGQQVPAGEVLAVLRKPELDLEFKRVWGELQTAQKKLGAVEAERLRDAAETEEQRRRHSELTAGEEELHALIANLQEQNGILRRQQAELEVRAPLAGTVLTWNLEEQLEARPVGRGQVLMTVADLAGPWVLELRVPEHRAAHVLAARAQIGPQLDISFVVASDPNVKLHATLARMSIRAEVAEGETPFVSATAELDRAAALPRIPAAAVVAKIHCGRRALGFVWLHELWEAVESWLWF